MAEPAPCPPISPGRHFPLRAALFFALAAVGMTWPLAVAPGELYSGRQDYYLGIWNLWHVAQALTEPGQELFRTGLLYFPAGTGLEAQPLTLLQTVAAAPLTLLLGPVTVFNLLVLFAFAFAGWTASLWVRAETGDALAGILAGVIFTFAPFHYTYLPQLNLVATGLVPLYFLAALGLRRRASPLRAFLAGTALAAVGFGSWYYGVTVGLVAVLWSLARLLGGEGSPRRRFALEGVHWGTCLLLLLPALVPMLPAFRGIAHVAGPDREGLSLVMEGFKGTSIAVGLWSFLGLFPLVLAGFGLHPLKRSGALLGLTGLFLLLALGESVTVGSFEFPLPFALFQDLPLLRVLRYPDRFAVIVQLSLAALAGLGFLRLRAWMAERRSALFLPAGLLLILLALLEFFPGRLPSRQPTEHLPLPEQVAANGGRALLHLPVTFRNLDGEAMFHQTRHGRPLVGGYLTRPDPDAVATQRSLIGPLAAPFGAAGPGPLPAELAEELARRELGLVCVQRRPLAPGAGPAGGRLFGPFCLGAEVLLRERLFPTYPLHQKLAVAAPAWEAALRERLGPPLAENDLAAVFAVPHP